MDKTGALAVLVGKRSFASRKVGGKSQAALDAVIRSRPEGFKGKFIKTFT